MSNFLYLFCMLITNRQPGVPLQLIIMSKLIDDGRSLQALMETCRHLRVLGSSLVKNMEVSFSCDGSPVAFSNLLGRFPRHATASKLTLSWLWIPWQLRPNPGWMQLPSVADWLVSAETCRQLTSVTQAHISWHEGGAHEVNEAIMIVLFKALALACPTLKCLTVDWLPCQDVIYGALLSALGCSMRHITELYISSDNESEILDLDIPGIDWATCFPPNLRKLELHSICLHRELLKHLLQMPQLEEVKAWSLSIDEEDELPPLSTIGCAWRKLTLTCINTFHDLNILEPWPEQLTIIVELGNEYEWSLGSPSPHLPIAMRTALSRLVSGISCHSIRLLSLH